LQIKAIRALKTDSSEIMKAALPILADLATHDVNYPVRAAAINVLGKTKSGEYAAIYKSSLASPSYTVKGAALNALNTLSPAEAFQTAKSLEAHGKGQLQQAIINVYATSGSDKEWPFVINAFKKGSVQNKFDLVRGPLAQMVARLTNSQYAQEGITAIRDLAVSYKRYGIAPKLITALQEIAEARKKLNDSASATLAEDAVKVINEAK
jgi:aminopeptidase N